MRLALGPAPPGHQSRWSVPHDGHPEVKHPPPSGPEIRRRVPPTEHHEGVIQDWEHHELRRSRRDLYHLSHEVALREAHAVRREDPATHFSTHDFRAVALLADAVECYAATSRTGSRPPDAAPIEGDGVNGVVLGLADVLAVELRRRLDEAAGASHSALDNLLDKVIWAAEVLRLRAG